MLYLVAQYDKDFKISFPPGTRDFYEVCCALHYNYWPLSHGIYSDEQLDIFHERWCRSDARQVSVAIHRTHLVSLLTSIGQSNHFYRYAPEQIPYGINRYQVGSIA